LQYSKFKIELVDNDEEVVIQSLIPSFLRFLFAPRVDPQSFRDIYEALKENYFDIVEGNDVDEVSRFVSFLEASEYEGE
jgi:hypothetical protein